MPSTWHIYMVRTDTGALYTGISTNVEKRFEAHCAGRGSKFLRAQSNLQLVYQCELGNRSLASKAEYGLKTLDKKSKELLVSEQPNQIELMSQLNLVKPEY